MGGSTERLHKLDSLNWFVNPKGNGYKKFSVMTNENEKLKEAIEDFKLANPNAIELQQRLFHGYLFNCATGAEDLSTDAILFNQTLIDLLKVIN